MRDSSPKLENHAKVDPGYPRSKTDSSPVHQDSHQWLRQLDSPHQRKQKQDFDLLQNNIAGYIIDAQRQCNEMGLILENGREALQQMDEQDHHSHRKALIGVTAALRRTQTTMANKLGEMETYITRSYVSINQLWDELERVRVLSLTDHYTGLPNRRAFLQRLENEMSRSLRYQGGFAIALIDLDKFKSVNDQFGHAAGDMVLDCYANDVLSEIRHHDIVARYGGEEFAVLFPNTEYAGALSALSNLRERAARIRCEVARGLRIPIPTFSAGLTMYCDGDSTETLIGRADDALYQAKKHGRDRVEIKQPPEQLPRRSVDQST